MTHKNILQNLTNTTSQTSINSIVYGLRSHAKVPDLDGPLVEATDCGRLVADDTRLCFKVDDVIRHVIPPPRRSKPLILPRWISRMPVPNSSTPQRTVCRSPV